MRKKKSVKVRGCVRREHLKKPMTVIDCMKRTMPKWVDLSEISDYQKCNEEYLLSATNTVISEIDTLSAESKKFVHDHFSLVAGVY